MSKQNVATQRLTVLDIKKMRNKEKKIVSLTAYSSYGAEIADEFCDFLLVGDSVGSVIYGMDTTIGVTLDMMIRHAKAVVEATKRALVVVDMPFGTYEASPEFAYHNCIKVMKETNCGAVKIEGGSHIAPTIEFLSSRGIPVMAHIGLTPQHYNSLGGYKVQGRGDDATERLLKDAKAVQEAGAFALVLEAMVEKLAVDITNMLEIPTIGIGASKECNGQILVTEDMLGVYDRVPKFVKKYGNMREEMRKAIASYAEDVRANVFPTESELYSK